MARQSRYIAISRFTRTSRPFVRISWSRKWEPMACWLRPRLFRTKTNRDRRDAETRPAQPHTYWTSHLGDFSKVLIAAISRFQNWRCVITFLSGSLRAGLATRLWWSLRPATKFATKTAYIRRHFSPSWNRAGCPRRIIKPPVIVTLGKLLIAMLRHCDTAFASRALVQLAHQKRHGPGRKLWICPINRGTHEVRHKVRAMNRKSVVVNYSQDMLAVGDCPVNERNHGPPAPLLCKCDRLIAERRKQIKYNPER
jgi:hypothetical protein